MRLREQSSKFSGGIGECWAAFVDNYSQVEKAYNLSIIERRQSLHNILCEDAPRFYLGTVN